MQTTNDDAQASKASCVQLGYFEDNFIQYFVNKKGVRANTRDFRLLSVLCWIWKPTCRALAGLHCRPCSQTRLVALPTLCCMHHGLCKALRPAPGLLIWAGFTPQHCTNPTHAALRCCIQMRCLLSGTAPHAALHILSTRLHGCTKCSAQAPADQPRLLHAPSVRRCPCHAFLAPLQRSRLRLPSAEPWRRL